MRAGRSKDLVAAAALAGALGLGGFLVLRAHGFLGEHWTDGARRFASETGIEVRHAVWDAPERWSELGQASDPALSPDGRWLVFASGARGLNVELFAAELVDGVPAEPRPLVALNSPADELAPAFGDDGLYFASDRAGGAGRLDLWRASYSQGEFGRAEPLAPGLNSSADETDPAPRPGTRTLVFASDRARADFDLYAAAPDGEGFALAEPLAALNSPAEERGPTFASDGRSLYFASDRPGGPGGGDLYRAALFADGWRAPECVLELSTAGAERAPWVANDGFALFFERADEQGGAWIERARSLEIFREPAPGVTLAQWITLAGLLLLALLALLAKRWSALDIFYKCLLASLVLHLLLMLYFRTVVPEGAPVELGPPRAGPTFRVRRAPPEPGEGEGGAGLAPTLARQPFRPPGARAEAPEVAALAVPEREAEAAPARESAELAPAPSAAPAPSLAGPAETTERYATRAPELALEALEGPARVAERDAPERARLDAAALGEASRAAPAPDGVELGAAPREPEQAPGRQALEAPALASAQGAERALDAPALRTAIALGPLPAASARPEFDATAGLGPRTELPGASEVGGPARRAAAEASAELARASPSAASGLAPRQERAAESGPAPERALAQPGESENPAAPSLRAPVAELGAPTTQDPSRRFDALAGAASAPPHAELPGASELGGPARPTPGEANAQVAHATPSAGSGLATHPEGLPESAPAPERSSTQPEASESPAGPALRAPVAERNAPSTQSPSPRFDALGRASNVHARAELPGARELDGPVRRAPDGASPELAHATPSAATGLASQPESAPEAAPARELARAAPGASEGAAAPELRAPVAERSAPATSSPSPRFDALAGLAPASAPLRAAPAEPERAAPSPVELSSARPAPGARVLAELPPEAPPAPPERASAPRLLDTPYQNRFGELKLRALEEFGGSQETEHAVAAGLAYLARIQGREGAWGQRSDAHDKYLDVRVGKSALALLAFLGAGHLPGGEGEHAAVAERTVRYLLGTQDPETGHFGRSCSYGHGIATYALGECYALTRDEALRAPLERALEEVLRHQSRVRDPRTFGGWGYYFADGHVWNGDEWPRTSVTAWQVMALESARLGGLAVPDQALADAREFLLNTWDAERRAFRYDHDPERLASGYPILPASTPAALFALSLLGVDAKARELGEARRFVLARAPDGYRYTGDDDFVQAARGNLYFWYYATLALFRVGGREWERWNAALQSTLLPAQDEDGSWRPLDVYSEYAGDEDDERTYSTAMCVLSLEIYYRYFTPLLEVR